MQNIKGILSQADIVRYVLQNIDELPVIKEVLDQTVNKNWIELNWYEINK